MRRILSTGSLLLALTGAAWAMPGCDGDDTAPVDAGAVDVNAVDTSAPPPDVHVVDTSAPLPDADEG